MLRGCTDERARQTDRQTDSQRQRDRDRDLVKMNLKRPRGCVIVKHDLSVSYLIILFYILLLFRIQCRWYPRPGRP